MLNIDEGFVLYTLPFGKCEIIITKIVLKYRKELYSFLKISTITVRIFSEINNTPNFQKINPKYFCRLFKEI